MGYELTDMERSFFETYGYLKLPGWMVDEIGWIEEEFEGTFADRGIKHDGRKRSALIPFIDLRQRMCSLLDHPRIQGLVGGLLGSDFNYQSSDGNYYTGDTPWHRDGYWAHGLFAKLAFYLDPVRADSGALRLIPGSQRLGWPAPRGNGMAVPGSDRRDGPLSATEPFDSRELWGIEPEEVPAVAIDSDPGDAVIFNHNMLHAAFGGSTRRRMFTMNFSRHCRTPEEIDELRVSIASHGNFGMEQMHSDLMLESASPERMRHLRQVIDNQDHLPQVSARNRELMEQAAAGANRTG